MTKQFPYIYRFNTGKVIGVKTYKGDVQYGKSKPIPAASNPDLELDKLENDLRAKLAGYSSQGQP